MVYQTNQNLSQKDIIEKSHIVLLQPGHILRVKWLAETIGRSFGWKGFFFLAFPSCQQSGNFIKKHGRCTEKTHHGLLPVTIMSVRWWYFSGALDCGLPWRPTQVK
jgi:hypothetical protein